VGLLVSWLLTILVDSEIFPQSESLAPAVVIGSYILINGLIWKKVVVKGWRLLMADNTETTILVAVSLLWMLLLNAVQGYSILWMGFGILFAMGGGLQF
jgi:hypothetical protein